MDYTGNIIVRTVTVFIPHSKCKPETTFRKTVAEASALVQKVRTALIANKVCVQTVRISTPGPASFGSVKEALLAAQILEKSNVDFASLGVVNPADKGFVDADFYTQVIRSTQTVSIAASLTSSQGINRNAICAAATAVLSIENLDANGFSNLRFAALANVRANGPFFPGSFSGEEGESGSNTEFKVALGIQGATLLNEIVQACSRDKDAVYDTLTTAIEQVTTRLSTIGNPCIPGKLEFDFSTAPFPTSADSIGKALAACAGVERFPGVGGLGVAGRVAGAIDCARFPQCGFCGIMLPVCEDIALAKDPPTLSELLMCSAVCGTGLDTVPIPGNVSVESVKAIFMDVATLSMRLGGKQLTIRLLPVPGKQAGQVSTFESQYLCNGPVVSIPECYSRDEEGESENVFIDAIFDKQE